MTAMAPPGLTRDDVIDSLRDVGRVFPVPEKDWHAGAAKIVEVKSDFEAAHALLAACSQVPAAAEALARNGTPVP